MYTVTDAKKGSPAWRQTTQCQPAQKQAAQNTQCFCNYYTRSSPGSSLPVPAASLLLLLLPLDLLPLLS